MKSMLKFPHLNWIPQRGSCQVATPCSWFPVLVTSRGSRHCISHQTLLREATATPQNNQCHSESNFLVGEDQDFG